MSLSARIELARGSFDLAVDFEVPAGTVLALLGPNGSGKSSVLGCLAGLVAPLSAEVTLAGRTLDGLAPHARGIGLLSQDALLFPHLSVVDNVAFAPRSTGAGRRRSRELAYFWLAEVDAIELADRKPGQLSGGQAQRVAIARALAAEPDLLLLDEPLAAPRTAFTARIAGLNLVAGTAVDAGLRTPSGQVVAGIPAADVVPGEAAVAVFAPSTVALYPHDGEHRGSPRNTADAEVTALEPHGPVIRVRVTGEGWAEGLTADLTPAAVAELALEPGSAVTLSVKAATVSIHPAAP